MINRLHCQEWEPILKPTIERKIYRFKLLGTSVDSTDVLLDESNTQPQADASYISPETSATMPPPPLPPKNTSDVKTPRPDITVGFRHGVIANKLRLLGVKEPDNHDILNDLQFDQQLYSSPTQPALAVRFPSMVVEGKSYATGRSMYEAENQAAVSGSCMLVIQQQLTSLTQQLLPGSISKEPLSFSITHEGPILLLWAHYLAYVGSVRFYNAHVMRICHVTIPQSVRDFFVALAGWMTWASSDLLDDISKQVASVWKAV